MSSDLQWMVIRNNSSFLVKRNGTSFSRESNNVKNKNSLRYNGLVHDRTVGVEPAKDGKGVVLVTKVKKNSMKPAKSLSRVELKRGSRRTLNSIRKILKTSGYRKDLVMPSVRRASAILKSQKPVLIKKTRGKKKE